jgi:hypothetical protein
VKLGIVHEKDAASAVESRIELGFQKFGKRLLIESATLELVGKDTRFVDSND